MELLELLLSHIRKYRISDVRDIYKLIYQGTLGNAHFMALDEGIAQKHLEEEMNFLLEYFKLPIMENISLNYKFVRINLSPFKWYSLSPRKLLFVMQESAKINIEKTVFLEQWKEFRGLIENEEEMKLFFTIEDFEEFDAEMKDLNYPAVSHSKVYRANNEPAYRVVSRDIFLQHFSAQCAEMFTKKEKKSEKEDKGSDLNDDWYLDILGR